MKRLSGIQLVAFSVPVVLFGVLNILSYLRKSCIGADCTYWFGFPFAVYMHGTFMHFDDVLWLGIILNILVTILAGLALAWLAGVWTR
jgi:hypothetical protein